MGVVTSAGGIAILLPDLRRIVRQPIAARRMTDSHSARAHGTPEQIRQQRRRADALALLTESSVRSYPSWIAELRRKSPKGVNRRRYAGEHIRAGDSLELVRQSADPKDRHAVAYYHRGVHLGFVPKRHHWVAEALDDGLRLAAIAETVKVGWIFRRRAKFVGTRIVIVHHGR